MRRGVQSHISWRMGSADLRLVPQSMPFGACVDGLKTKEMKMKTRIKAVTDSIVEIRFVDGFTDELREYRFYANADGGYVRFGPDGKQICERLGITGPTLMWPGKEPLINLIRKEYRAMRRYEKSMGLTA